MPGVQKLLRPRDLEETEHFRRWRQQEVAKIVQCGENYSLINGEATSGDGLKFLRHAEPH